MKNIKKINPATQIVMSFVIVILIGAILLSLPISSNNGEWFPFIDSLFTSTSAVCVTGLIVADTAVQFSLFGQIVIMLLIQIGGLGFITVSALVFLILGKKISYQKRLTIQESLNQDSNQGVVKLVKKIITLVFTCEFIGFLCLLPTFISDFGVGKGIFTSLFLAVSAFCNAGFDILGTSETAFQSLAHYNQNYFVLIPIMLLIIIGGIGYLVIFELIGKEKNKKLSIHSKIVLTITSLLIFGGAILFLILEWNNPLTIGNLSFSEKILNSFMQSITPRTAGFSTFNQSDLTNSSIILTNFLMFIGGSPASTAGGIKTTTIFILLLTMFKSTNNKGELVIKEKRICASTIRKCFRIFSLAILLIISSVFFISVLEISNFTSTEILFEVISAISTVGISLGITTSLSNISKVIILLLMFVGRVGAVTITVAFSNKNKENQEIEYPDSKIMVG